MEKIQKLTTLLTQKCERMVNDFYLTQSDEDKDKLTAYSVMNYITISSIVEEIKEEGGDVKKLEEALDKLSLIVFK